MNMLNNAEYYRARAAQARARAEAATLPEVRCVHAEMAERYRLLEQEAAREGHASGIRPTLGIVHRG